MWSIESLIASAKPYKTLSVWRMEQSAAYQSARRRNLLHLCCKHMSTRERIKLFESQMVRAKKNKFVVEIFTDAQWALINLSRKDPYLADECLKGLFHLEEIKDQFLV